MMFCINFNNRKPLKSVIQLIATAIPHRKLIIHFGNNATSTNILKNKINDNLNSQRNGQTIASASLYRKVQQQQHQQTNI